MLLGHLAHDGQAQPAALAAPGVGARGRSGRTRRAGPRGRRRCRGRGPRRRWGPTWSSTVPPGGEWRAALSSRLLMARASRSGTPSMTRGRRAWRRSGCRARCAGRAPATRRRRRRGGRPRSPAPGWSPRASSMRSPTSAVSSSLCSTTSASRRRRSSGSSSTLLEQDLDVGAQAGDRRAQLVRGVGDELALGAHRLVQRLARGLEAVEHRVEAGGELAHLVVGVDVEALGEVLGLADLLGDVGHLGQRRQHAAGGHAAEDRGERDAAERASRPGSAGRSEQDVVHAVERAGELDAPPGHWPPMAR